MCLGGTGALAPLLDLEGLPMSSSNRTNFIRPRWLALPLGAVVATMADASTAADAPLSPDLHNSTLSPQDAIETYWTPERMAAATPAEAPPMTGASTTTDDRVEASDPAITTPGAPPRQAGSVGCDVRLATGGSCGLGFVVGRGSP